MKRSLILGLLLILQVALQYILLELRIMESLLSGGSTLNFASLFLVAAFLLLRLLCFLVFPALVAGSLAHSLLERSLRA
jgi:hypothetical protein